MSSQSNEDGTVRVELKYCEHCGGLWLREGGGGVYCERCQKKMAEFPEAKKKRPGRLKLPVRGEALVDRYEEEQKQQEQRRAVGGAA